MIDHRSPWSPAFYETGRVKLVFSAKELTHGITGEFAPDTQSSAAEVTFTEDEAHGKINVLTGVLTYPKNAEGVRKTPEEIEDIRRRFISAQGEILAGTLAKKFKTAKSLAEVYTYIDSALEETKYWLTDDKLRLLNQVAYGIRRLIDNT